MIQCAKWSDEERLFVEINFHLMTITELQDSLEYEFDIRRSTNAIKTFAYRTVKVSRKPVAEGDKTPERQFQRITHTRHGVVHRLI